MCFCKNALRKFLGQFLPPLTRPPSKSMTRLGIGEETKQRVFRKREFGSYSGVKESAKEQEKIVTVCV